MASLKLLLISNPEAYNSWGQETPFLYDRLLKEPDLEIYHADSDKIQPGYVLCRRMFSGRVYEDYKERSVYRLKDWREFDVAWDRTYRPFRSAHLHTLEEIERGSPGLFLNNPLSRKVVDTLEFQTRLSQAHSYGQTYALRDFIHLTEILSAYPNKRFVLKDIRNCGGGGITIIRNNYRGRICQGAYQLRTYLPNKGEVRITAIDGVVRGCMAKTAGRNGGPNNTANGSVSYKYQPDEHMLEVVNELLPIYNLLGLRTLGFDFLRASVGTAFDSLSEVNVGNIGGIDKERIICGNDMYPHIIKLIRKVGESR